MAELTPEMRAEMRKAADAGTRSAMMIGGFMFADVRTSAAVLALLDYCDRLERERDEVKSKFDHFWDQAYEQKTRAETAESALAAAHERMREMKEALEPFARWAADWADEKDEDGFDVDPLMTYDDHAASASDLCRAARVLDRPRTSEGGGAT